MDYFFVSKEIYYGSEATSDSGIGTGKHDTQVQVVRVPHYADMKENGTLAGNAWDGYSGGVMAFRVGGMLDGSGESISATDCGIGGGQKGETRVAGLGAKTGSLEKGKWADLVILNKPDYRVLSYEFGSNPVKNVLKMGTLIR